MKFIEKTKFRNSTCISYKKIVDKTKFRNLLGQVRSHQRGDGGWVSGVLGVHAGRVTCLNLLLRNQGCIGNTEPRRGCRELEH